MSSVMVRIRAVEFSATIAAISEWLHANQYEPTRYKYEEHEDAVFVTVDFAGEMEAEAFATRFDGVYGLYLQSTSPDIPPPVA
jgi:hypothetical protein